MHYLEITSSLGFLVLFNQGETKTRTTVFTLMKSCRCDFGNHQIKMTPVQAMLLQWRRNDDYRKIPTYRNYCPDVINSPTTSKRFIILMPLHEGHPHCHVCLKEETREISQGN